MMDTSFSEGKRAQSISVTAYFLFMYVKITIGLVKAIQIVWTSKGALIGDWLVLCSWHRFLQ